MVNKIWSRQGVQSEARPWIVPAKDMELPVRHQPEKGRQERCNVPADSGRRRQHPACINNDPSRFHTGVIMQKDGVWCHRNRQTPYGTFRSPSESMTITCTVTERRGYSPGAVCFSYSRCTILLSRRQAGKAGFPENLNSSCLSGQVIERKRAIYGMFEQATQVESTGRQGRNKKRGKRAK